MFIYNPQIKKKVKFSPRSHEQVTMYVCGPTVYNEIHIGNARTIVFFDLLKRILQTLFGKVLYVRNITDIDDKIINKANEEGISPQNISERYTKTFERDCAYLLCNSPDIEPKATECIQDMIIIIQDLIEKGHAYVHDHCVYFSVNSFREYGKLSGRTLEEMLPGARIDISEHKKNPLDFALWKKENNDVNKHCSFDSPWGLGRPGWHIECSAMSKKFLGPSFDIHGGGEDLLFPHHENELAQSICADPKSKFAENWMRVAFLLANESKMSKSLSNFVLVRELQEAGWSGNETRIALLSTHYRKPLPWNGVENLKAASAFLKRIGKALIDFEEIIHSISTEDLSDNFIGALKDDINVPAAITEMSTLISNITKNTNNSEKTVFQKQLSAACLILGINIKDIIKDINIDNNLININVRQEVEKLIKEREEARINKNYTKADDIRQKLSKLNIEVEDHSDGSSSWHPRKI